MEKIIEILKRCGFKGKYISAIKKANLWSLVEDKSAGLLISDTEKVYRYINPGQNIFCEGKNNKKFLGLTRGYSPYCSVKFCHHCQEKRKESVKNGVFNKYGVDNIGKLPAAIDARNKFWSNKESISKAKEKRKNTNLQLYGCESVFQNKNIKEKIKSSNKNLYGVENPSQAELIKDKKKLTTFNNYGVEHPMQSLFIKQKTKNTNLKKYGFEYPTQNAEIKNKVISTKISRGLFGKSNSSIEATLYFREYVKLKGYELSQVAYNDIENELYEWGYRFDRWYLYDFVAFEIGCRGMADRILEIIEYHGPFHYTESDVILRGGEKAYPWKSNKSTISDSYQKDLQKEMYAVKYLTPNYTIVWSTK